MTTYCYRPVILEELQRHGLRPLPHTAPERVHEWVSDLYRYELRRLRQRLLTGDVQKQDYFGLVVDLRRAYPIVSLKPRQLVDEASVDETNAAGAGPA